MSGDLVIGTAGHIDHGKTALVRALTGTDTDRLAEEKRRGITIDLGFARFELPGGAGAGLVDVPGHEDFIRNMVAGASGIDLALLVVAADEGVMPQTREHLAILRMLGVERAVVALTKVDLVDDEWLALATDDLRAHLDGTPFAAAPVLPVSSTTGAGIEELRVALARAAEAAVARPGSELARMPVDRAFTVRGTGTVVTGTVRDGTIALGDEVHVLPGGARTRVRGIQCHGAAVERVGAGARAALALAGLDRAHVARGCWVVSDGWPLGSMLTVRLGLIADTDWHVRQRQRVRVHIGTAEVMARVVLLGAERLEPGRDAWAQLRLEGPVVARYGDRFVVRSYSPVTTIGGGTVLEPAAPKRRRLRDDDRALLAALEAEPADALPALVRAAGWSGLAVAELPVRAGVASDVAPARAEARRVGDRLVAAAVFEAGVDTLVAAVADWHAAFPLRVGMDQSEARRRLEPAQGAVADAIIAATLERGTLETREGALATPGHRVAPDPDQAAARDRLEQIFLAAGLAPPRIDELPGELAERPDLRDLLGILERERVLVPFPPDRLLHSRILDRARSTLLAELGGRTGLGPADFRTLFELPRKHLIPLLELFDRLGWTRREGEARAVAPSGDEDTDSAKAAVRPPSTGTA